MATYSVQINQRSLGIGLIEICNLNSSGNDEEVVISELIPNAKGDQLGLSIGDTLIAINNKPVKSMDSYYHSKIPFNATFQKSNLLSDGTQKQYNKNNNYYTNNNNHNTNTSNTSNTSNINDIQSSFNKPDSISMTRDNTYNYNNINNINLNINHQIRNRNKMNVHPLFKHLKKNSHNNFTNTRNRSSNRSSIKISEFIQCIAMDTKNRNKGYKNGHGLIKFDKYRIYNQSASICLLSSQCLSSGHYEWSFKVIKCSIYRQEIGVISNAYNFKHLCNNSITNATELGARAIYCTESASQSAYYASYNNNATQRCYKDLSSWSNDKNNKNNKNNNQKMNEWKQGDIIKVYLDLDRWNIKFYLNDKKVRKAISVEPYKKYYPVISFIGDCKYQLLSH